MLTYEKALELLMRAVEEKGEDYCYEEPSEFDSCIYFEHDASPSCIVGHVLHYLGFEPSEHWMAAYNVDQHVPCILGTFGYLTGGLTAAACLLLVAAQGYQDQAYPWGECVLRAVRDMEEDMPDDVAAYVLGVAA